MILNSKRMIMPNNRSDLKKISGKSVFIYENRLRLSREGKENPLFMKDSLLKSIACKKRKF